MEIFAYQRVIRHLIREQLTSGKKVVLRVSGGSMRPLIRKGDRVHIQGCDPRGLSTGDIITFRNDDLYVTHRLLWKIKKGNAIRLITKGDNEIAIDQSFSPDHIVGKVVTIQTGNQTFHLETPYWRLVNRLLGMLFLMETISIQLYRFAARDFSPLRTFVLANPGPSLLYCRLKNRGLGLATRIIM